MICSKKTSRNRLEIITNQRQYYTYLLHSEGITDPVIFEG
jgi:tryptophan synthase alpha subunit